MPEFEFSAGELCLDLANTWGNREDEKDDQLSCYGDLLEWALQAGIVDDGGRRSLQRRANRHPTEAEVAFGSAVALREVVFRVCSAAAAGRSPDESDLEILNQCFATAPRRRLCCGGECCEWERPEDDNNFHRVMWPVLRSVGELLTSAKAVATTRDTGGTTERGRAYKISGVDDGGGVHDSSISLVAVAGFYALHVDVSNRDSE